jgi:hypothetical protein
VSSALAAFTTCLGAPKFTSAPQPESECLFDSPEYDFNWQRLYQYNAAQAELPVVRPGDLLRWRCKYVNNISNQAVADGLQYQGLTAPVDVGIGDTTLDEMCLLVLQTLYKPYTPPAE